MPLPLTVSCFGKIQIGFSFLVLAYLGSPGKRAVKRVCVCVCVCVCVLCTLHRRPIYRYFIYVASAFPRIFYIFRYLVTGLPGYGRGSEYDCHEFLLHILLQLADDARFVCIAFFQTSASVRLRVASRCLRQWLLDIGTCQGEHRPWLTDTVSSIPTLWTLGNKGHPLQNPHYCHGCLVEFSRTVRETVHHVLYCLYFIIQ